MRREIQTQFQFCTLLPIIALTADAMLEHRSVYIESGITDFLTKPIEWDKLDSALLKLHSGSTISLCLENHTSTFDEISISSNSLALIEESKIFQIINSISRQDLSSLVSDIIITSNDDLVYLGAAIEQNDMAAIRRIAHSMKGMYSNFGADRLAFLSKKVQQANSVSDVEYIIPFISTTIEDTMAYFGSLIE